MFNCPFCTYSDIRKTSLIRHLLKKKKCNKTVKLELFNMAVDSLNKQKYTFKKFPDEVINYDKNIINLNFEELVNYIEKNPEIKEKLTKYFTPSIKNDNISDKSETLNDSSIVLNNVSVENSNIINGNNNNNNNNISYTLVYNNFGEEKINHITEEILAELCKSPYTACAELFKLINFNKEHIENFTVKSFNERNKFIYIRKDNEWQKENKNIVIEQIITKNNIILSNFMCQSGLKYFSNNSIEKIDNYFEVVSDENSGVYKRIAEKCLLNIINYSHTMQNNYNKYIEKNNILIPLPN